MLFKTDVVLSGVCKVTPQMLKKLGVKGLILDIDNTLTTHDNPVPAEGVMDWIQLMKDNNIKMYAVSNNHAPRVEPFAKILGLPFIPEGKKPLSNGFKVAQRKMNLPKSEIAAIGDQLFTDVWAANWYGVKMIYVKPIELETHGFLKVKRVWEKPFLKKIYKNMDKFN